ncbi:beta-propeller domain-containing protein [Patescibacteria group bacterium]|nr:beta-propeller domain-containing protein [Patescibacteria group bacterium]
MRKKTIITVVILVLVLIFLIGSLGSYFIIKHYKNILKQNGYTPDLYQLVQNQYNQDDFIQFASLEEYNSYYATASEYTQVGSWGMGASRGAMDFAEESVMAPTASDSMTNSYKATPDRVSETNVQVQGIDEPDIVKTNGREIFFSSENYYYWDMPLIRTDDSFSESYNYPEYNTKIVSAFPPSDLAQNESIDETGNLLIIDDNLIIISYDQVISYDISDPTKPIENWQFALDDNSSIYQARKYDNRLYLIASTYAYDYNNCPFVLGQSDQEIKINCQDIYHPVTPVPYDSIYTVMKLNPTSGKAEKTISFTGSADSSAVYMSTDNLYVTYSQPGDYVQIFLDFLQSHSGIYPVYIQDKITKLNSYDLGYFTKLMELENILTNYYNTLSDDDRLKFETDMQNALDEYMTRHKRELSSTIINQINTTTLEPTAIGLVPGELLNQFSLDEYNQHLRVATTTGQNWWGVPFVSTSSESVNDVYVLDDNLKITGQVLDMGEGERIYSARFIGDMGYVVTFRETDPFYVLDLSNPNKPVKSGELKIPGYSSYLHPISDDIILGVGKEESEVKLSMFDVSDPENPTETAKYKLNEYWSDILDTHHAFLLDDQHQIFFIPGSYGGYIFSYADDKLELKKAVDDISARRALYIDDYLYIVGDDQIVVLNENTWETEKTLDLTY